MEGWPPPKPWKKYQTTQMGSSQRGFVQSKSCEMALSVYIRVEGLGCGEEVRVLRLDFHLDVVPHETQISSRINHC